MNKKILLFDTDRTIFDTDKMSKIREGLMCSLLKITVDELQEIKGEYRKTLANEREFNPDDFVKILCNKLEFSDGKLVLDLYYGNKYKYFYEDSVYLEFFEVVEKLKNKCKFGIYSEAFKKFREHKFESMNIKKYFDPDLIFFADAKDTPEVVKQLPKDVIVVDDKESICEFLTENSIRAIWLNKKDDRVSKNFKTIHNLLELLTILK